jgi:hypothetical protein
MCKFKISVSTRTPSEIAEAERRFGSMANVSSVSVSDDRRTVIAEAELPGGGGHLKLTGWAKDNFGMHTSMNPSVHLMT